MARTPSASAPFAPPSRPRTGNAGTESTWLLGGLLADEWSTSSTFVQNDETDERQISAQQLVGRRRRFARSTACATSANQAIGLLKKYKPTPASDIAEMYFVRGFARDAVGVGLLQRHSAERRAGDDVDRSARRCRSPTCSHVAIASFDSAINLVPALMRRACIDQPRGARSARRARCSALNNAARPRRRSYRHSDDLQLRRHVVAHGRLQRLWDQRRASVGIRSATASKATPATFS